jgi:hypothetical protein
MPNFRVKGCFKENAEDVKIILEATSYKDAEHRKLTTQNKFPS